MRIKVATDRGNGRAASKRLVSNLQPLIPLSAAALDGRLACLQGRLGKAHDLGFCLFPAHL